MTLDYEVYNTNNSIGKGAVIYEEVNEPIEGIIVSYGTHPCCYVKFPGIEDIASYDDVDDIHVHGGFTFLGSFVNLKVDGIWLGWDYAHCGDYFHTGWDITNKDHASYGKAWTLDELKAELHKAILDFSTSKYVKT